MSDEEEDVGSEADYHHGAEEVARVFRDHLRKQLVEFEFRADNTVRLRLGSTEIVFLTQDEWVAQELRAAMKGGVKLMARVHGVSGPE